MLNQVITAATTLQKKLKKISGTETNSLMECQSLSGQTAEINLISAIYVSFEFKSMLSISTYTSQPYLLSVMNRDLILLRKDIVNSYAFPLLNQSPTPLLNMISFSLSDCLTSTLKQESVHFPHSPQRKAHTSEQLFADDLWKGKRKKMF